MTCQYKDPPPPLTEEKRNLLVCVSRSHAEPASHVARAKALLTVAEGRSYTEAAKAAGRRLGDGVSQLVSRFNREVLTQRWRRAKSTLWRRCSTVVADSTLGRHWNCKTLVDGFTSGDSIFLDSSYQRSRRYYLLV